MQYLRRVPFLPLTAPGLGAGERSMSPKLNIAAGGGVLVDSDFLRGSRATAGVLGALRHWSISRKCLLLARLESVSSRADRARVNSHPQL